MRGKSNDLQLKVFHHTQLGDFKYLQHTLQSVNEISPTDASTLVNMIDPLTTDSPLMMACRKGFAEIVKLFLSYGAKNDPHPDYGQTALHAAVCEKHFNVVSVLLEIAALSNAQTIICNLADPEGQTPLHIAAILGHTDIVEILLLHGAEIGSVDCHGHNPLHLCAGSGNISCLGCLLDHDGDLLLENPDNLGNTALHHASFYGHLECVRLLLETAADVLARNKQGHTPYSLASSRGHSEVCDLLLEYREHYNSVEMTRIKPTVNRSNQTTPSIHIKPGSDNMVMHADKTNLQEQHSIYNPHNEGTPISTTFQRDHIKANSYESNPSNRPISFPSYPTTPNQQDGFLQLRLHTTNEETNRKLMPLQYKRSLSEPINVLNDLPRPHTVGSPSVNGYSSKNSPVLKNPYKVLPKNSNQLQPTPEKSLFAAPQRSYSPAAMALFAGDEVVASSEVLAGPIAVMTKQNASLKPTSTSFRSLTLDNLASNNSSTTTMSSSTTESRNVYNNAPQSAPIFSTQHNAANSIFKSSPSRAKVYSLDDMSPSRKGLTNSIITKPAYFPGDMMNVVDSSFLIFKSASKETNKPTVAKDSYDYTTLYKDTEGFDFEIQRNRDVYNYASRLHSRQNSRTNMTNISESPGFSIGSEKKVSEKAAIAELTEESKVSNAVADGSSNDVEEYAEPLEVFTECGVQWHAYMSDTGDVYYLDMNAGHSQWEDPRLNGIVVTDYGEEQIQSAIYEGNDSNAFQEQSVSSRSSSIHSKTPIKSPPKSPSPKSPITQNENVKPPSNLKIEFKHEIERSSFSPTSTLEDEDDEKETILYRFDGLSVSRNLRWLDDDADCSFVDDEGEKSDAVKLPILGIAELNLTEDTLIANETEVGPESQSSSPKDDDSLVLSPGKYELSPLDQEIVLKENVELESVHREFNEDENNLTPLQHKVLHQNGISSLLECTSLRKYAKMYSMGIPIENVLMKMKLDSLSPQNRNKLLRALGRKEEDIIDERSSTKLKVGQPLQRSKSVGANSLQNIHWKPLPLEKLKRSVWIDGPNSGSGRDNDTDGEDFLTSTAALQIEDNEVKELQKLFAQQTPSTLSVKLAKRFGAKSNNQPDASDVVLKVLDPKRAQNIAIGLVPFKPFGRTGDFLRAVSSLDTYGGRITADLLDNFKYLLPSELELKRISDMVSSSHPVELFFQEIVTFYPQLPRRLQLFRSCLTFESDCEAIKLKLMNIVNTCNQVLSSGKLAKVLKKMLAVGNIMNKGTQRGEAYGISLDSLLQMVHIKGVDKKTTVLDYVVKSLYDRGDQGALSFVSDLYLLDDHSKMSAMESLNEVLAINNSLKAMEAELATNHNFLSSISVAHMSNNNALGNGDDNTFLTESSLSASPTTAKYPITGSATASKVLTSKFSINLENYMAVFRDVSQDLNISAEKMSEKVKELVEYFGEEPSSCDSAHIFGVLQQFKTAVALSKEAIETKKHRCNNSNINSSSTSTLGRPSSANNMDS